MDADRQYLNHISCSTPSMHTPRCVEFDADLGAEDKIHSLLEHECGVLQRVIDEHPYLVCQLLVSYHLVHREIHQSGGFVSRVSSRSRTRRCKKHKIFTGSGRELRSTLCRVWWFVLPEIVEALEGVSVSPHIVWRIGLQGNLPCYKLRSPTPMLSK